MENLTYTGAGPAPETVVYCSRHGPIGPDAVLTLIVLYSDLKAAPCIWSGSALLAKRGKKRPTRELRGLILSLGFVSVSTGSGGTSRRRRP